MKGRKHVNQIRELRSWCNQIHIKPQHQAGKKYNKTATKWTDDKQSWQLFPQKVGTLLPKPIRTHDQLTQLLKEKDQKLKHYLTINKKYHSESTALERSVMNYWGGVWVWEGGVRGGALDSFTGSQPSSSARSFQGTR